LSTPFVTGSLWVLFPDLLLKEPESNDPVTLLLERRFLV